MPANTGFYYLSGTYVEKMSRAYSALLFLGHLRAWAAGRRLWDETTPFASYSPPADFVSEDERGSSHRSPGRIARPMRHSDSPEVALRPDRRRQRRRFIRELWATPKVPNILRRINR